MSPKKLAPCGDNSGSRNASARISPFFHARSSASYFWKSGDSPSSRGPAISLVFSARDLCWIHDALALRCIIPTRAIKLSYGVKTLNDCENASRTATASLACAPARPTLAVAAPRVLVPCKSNARLRSSHSASEHGARRKTLPSSITGGRPATPAWWLSILKFIHSTRRFVSRSTHSSHDSGSPSRCLGGS
ncbi:hypothetical protein GGF44_003380 [Coemansia sp. RSA 1694]|nr:hypothetical protein GGF44_003380 [Coemansia sp. RSA 1694]